jgi:hypothetical protein
MKRMTGTVYNLLECSLKTTQHVTVLLRFVESRVLHRFTRPEELAEYEVQHSSMHRKDWKGPESMCVTLILRTILLEYKTKLKMNHTD